MLLTDRLEYNDVSFTVLPTTKVMQNTAKTTQDPTKKLTTLKVKMAPPDSTKIEQTIRGKRHRDGTTPPPPIPDGKRRLTTKQLTAENKVKILSPKEIRALGLDLKGNTTFDNLLKTDLVKQLTPKPNLVLKVKKTSSTTIVNKQNDGLLAQNINNNKTKIDNNQTTDNKDDSTNEKTKHQFVNNNIFDNDKENSMEPSNLGKFATENRYKVLDAIEENEGDTLSINEPTRRYDGANGPETTTREDSREMIIDEPIGYDGDTTYDSEQDTYQLPLITR